MAAQLRFDNKVAIITGAGSETGRQCAVLLAKRGASVLVNDISTVYSGRPEATYVADLIVEEICASGGVAISNHDSVQYGERIVRTALAAFGRIDIVVNCAVVTRDQLFGKILNTDWALMARINLRGTFLVMKAAWPYMKKQKAGRVVNVGSLVGLAGAKSMSMTAASKMGLHGLTRALASEGEKFNIRINTIAPLKPLTRTPSSDTPYFPASKVAPLVLLLSHDNSTANGHLFAVGGGLVTQVRPQRSKGMQFDEGYSVEDVWRCWGKLASFDGETDSPGSVEEAMQKFKKSATAKL